jgi:hypothetical protein
VGVDATSHDGSDGNDGSDGTGGNDSMSDGFALGDQIPPPVDVPPPTDGPMATCVGSASGNSPIWTCTTDHMSRQRCNAGTVDTEACAHGCVSQPLGTDDYCAPDCSGSASGTSPIWTCTSDHTARQRCQSGGTQTESCPGGCIPQPIGTDDYCANCATSASGTSSIWTCTSDHTQRQRCVMGMVQTEACASGCISQPLGVDDYCATGCSASASGTSSIWTCTSDHMARQRCVSGAVQTESCMYGCLSMPLGTDDVCAPMPSAGGSVQCAYPQWWTRPYSWSPGWYTIRYGIYNYDNDLSVAAWTPIQLRHRSTLLTQNVYAWGWMPEFLDEVTGQHFRLLHLQPSRRLVTISGSYPAGTLVGYSGGDTTATGYYVPIPGCTGSPCVYSTGAHLCVQTSVPFHDAFPATTDACM